MGKLLPPLEAPRLTAFEGVSGVGKSWHIGKLIKSQPDLQYIERPTLPRVTGPQLGAYASALNEYNAILYSTIYQADCVVDRFMLSRPVYRHLESGVGPFDLVYARLMIRSSWLNLTATAMQEARNRLDPNAIYLRPIVNLTVLLPSPERLQMTRDMGRRGGRLYPYDGTAEPALYELLANHLIDFPILGININIVRLD